MDGIEGKLIEAVASITGKDDISPDAPLHEIGVDSLGFVELVVYVEKTFNVRLIEHNLKKEDFASISALAAFVKSRS